MSTYNLSLYDGYIFVCFFYFFLFFFVGGIDFDLINACITPLSHPTLRGIRAPVNLY